MNFQLKPMIKTIVFDFGKVLVDFDLSQFVQQLSNSSPVSEGRVRQVVSGSKMDRDYSTGKIGTEQFLKGLKKKLSLEMSTKEIASAYTNIFSPNEEVQSLVKRLKGHYRLQLYSDTCPLHYEEVIKQSPIFSLFDATTFSFRVGALKETKQGFKDVIRKANCAPNEIAYTDDIKGYVERARTLELRAFHFEDAKQLKDDLKQLEVVWD